MRIWELKDVIAFDKLGQQMHDFISELYPICRSITGEGVRETLRIVQGQISLELHEVPTSTDVLDWTIPREWNIKDAYIMNSNGERVVDFRESNLHVMGYSVPVKEKMRLSELRKHLHTLPEQPDWIPYRTSYYNEDWAFCISQNQLLELDDDEYEVCIDSSLEDGYLTYGEYYLQGQTLEEVLISSHTCHPSMCNDNLSGIALVTFLAKYISTSSHRYSYRFLFAPATIGSLTWLASNEENVHRIKHGLVIACVGDPGSVTYKKSRRGDAEIDRVAKHVLRHYTEDYQIRDFSPYGYDERQYCSPGFNLTVGSLTRSPNGEFDEYHTSADNLDLVQPMYLADSFIKVLTILDVLEDNKTYMNLFPKGEPQLGKRGLYRKVGGPDIDMDPLAVLWVLNLSDGQHSLLSIADRADIKFDQIRNAANVLLDHNLLEEIPS